MASSALSTSTGGYYTSTGVQGLIFDAYTPFTLKSATAYAKTTANRTIYLSNSNGSIIDSLVTSISTGTQSVNIGFHVPVGKGYILSCSKGNSLWRETSGAAYPYTVANVMSMTSSTAGSAYYYYFYKWQILADSCISARVPVTASIITGIEENKVSVNYKLYPNPTSGEVTLTLNSQQEQRITVDVADLNGKIVFSDQLNLKGDIERKYNFEGHSKGIYFVRIITEKEVHNEKIIVE
jgi:hypothetical protein